MALAQSAGTRDGGGMTESAGRATGSGPAHRAGARRRVAELAVGPSVLASMLAGLGLIASARLSRR